MPDYVVEAMIEANKSYVDMNELLKRTGDHIASLLGYEAARVTPGAAAGLALATAGCMTGKNNDAIRRIPNTTGLRNEVIIQKIQRYVFDRCIESVGAKLVEVGSADKTTRSDIEDAITDRTAAILFDDVSVMAKLVRPDPLPLEEVVEVANSRGIPVIVDAASNVIPPQGMTKYAKLGVAVAVFAGKYMGAPQATGFVCGKKEIVEAIAANDFMGFHVYLNGSLGRVMKMDRQSIMGLVVALEHWMKLDYYSRSKDLKLKADTMIREINEIEGLTAEHANRFVPFSQQPLNEIVQVSLTGRGEKDVAKIVGMLASTEPAIATEIWDNKILINVAPLREGDARIVVEKFKKVMH